MLAGHCTQYSNLPSTSSRSRRLPPESKSNRRASSSSSIVLSFACPLQVVRNSPVNTTLKRNIFIILNLTLQQTINVSFYYDGLHNMHAAGYCNACRPTLHITCSPTLHITCSPALHITCSPAPHITCSPALHITCSMTGPVWHICTLNFPYFMNFNLQWASGRVMAVDGDGQSLLWWPALMTCSCEVVSSVTVIIPCGSVW